MPASSEVGGPPSVPMSFSNNFWGKSDLGVDPLLTRMANAKTTCDELKAFYKARAELEEEYAKKLFAISRKALGSVEMGTLRASLDVARGETETMGKQHALIAQQIKSECEEPLAAFAGGIKERRKIVQNGIERLLKTKQQQTAVVNKCRDRYEQDCLRIKGYLAQGHMVMGQEERKNKAKLEKTQINMASNSQEYEAAIKVLEDTTGRWNKEWKAACDKFQDLEEERLDFTKSSLWAFANIASTVCVSDDASCEKVRLALENCEVEKDIANFIRVCGTGQEIQDPPRYINFAKEDCDTASEISEDENYSVAQFSRTMNPAFRTASPVHEIKEPAVERQSVEREVSQEPQEKVAPVVPDPNSGRPQPLSYRQPEPNMPPNYSPSQHGDIAQIPHNEYPTEGMTMYCRRDDQPSRMTQSDLSAGTRPPSRDSNSDYSNPSSFTSAEPMSGKTSPIKQPPINGVAMPGMSSSPEKGLQKRRSGFFSKSPFNANSPFRRKSKKEPENPVSRNTWSVNMSRSDLSSSSTQSSPTKQYSRQPSTPFNRNAAISAPEGEEPADPRANFQLNIGPNVLDVASPDTVSSSHQSTPRASVANTRRGNFVPALTASSDDPVAQALANLKQSSSGFDMSKRASLRQPVDAYHRVKTPAPDQKPAARPALMSAQTQDVFAAQRGTPPPAYEGTRAQSALGVPQPAFTSKEMRARTENWGMGSSVSAPVQRPGSSIGRPASRDGRRSPAPSSTGIVPRAASPSPQTHSTAIVRSRSPIPRQAMPIRARSPAPVQAAPPMRARSPAPPIGPDPTMRARSPAPDMHMRASPNAQTRPQPKPKPQPQQQQPQSQPQPKPQAQPQPQPQSGSSRSRQTMMDGGSPAHARPASSYGAPQTQQAAPSAYDQRARNMDPAVRRERSKSIAAPGMMSGASTTGSHMRHGSASQAQPQSHSQYRAASPAPPQNHSQYRAASPAPPQNHSQYRTASPAPPQNHSQYRAASPAPPQGHSQYRAASPNPYAAVAGQAAAQPSGRARSQTGGSVYHNAATTSQIQLAPVPGEMAMYEPPGNADVSPSVCFMARAMYTYTAAIPEELSFAKGDILAVLRLQDDGWWEAEVSRSAKTGGPGSGEIGLVPSNYLQRC
ncbi:formin-binding protein [Neophaeococcomyces mojaviensis]|uniref:Formin-binding protein n=1 Tax=Neophaeococcomyces mojaviensis TaxID=3383035 RepID=A0ACC3AJJ6_9EURO|nr:formin-binding protein [Knufia sp. JES_112]